MLAILRINEEAIAGKLTARRWGIPIFPGDAKVLLCQPDGGTTLAFGEAKGPFLQALPRGFRTCARRVHFVGSSAIV